MAENSVVTIRLDPDLKAKLEALARSTQRTKSFLAAEAIAAYVDLNAWQIGEIQRGLAEAEAGDFASDAEMEEFFAKWSE